MSAGTVSERTGLRPAPELKNNIAPPAKASPSPGSSPAATPAATPVATATPIAKTSPNSSPGEVGTKIKNSFVIPPEKSRPVTLPKFDQAPVIDGKIDDPIWQHAVILKDFYQIQPGDNTPAP